VCPEVEGVDNNESFCGTTDGRDICVISASSLLILSTSIFIAFLLHLLPDTIVDHLLLPLLKELLGTDETEVFVLVADAVNDLYLSDLSVESLLQQGVCVFCDVAHN